MTFIVITGRQVNKSNGQNVFVSNCFLELGESLEKKAGKAEPARGQMQGGE